jgi:protocatechuate 3,4-dioxygenase, beta subunit
MNLRRHLIKMLAALPFFSAALQAQTPLLKPTPQDVLGPFYPPKWTGEIDNDLITFAGKNFVKGTPLALGGRVRSVDGKAVIGATVEIWQTDDTGKYRHPDDDGEGPAARGFQGFGRTVTDAEGRYTFRTIKPVLYSGRPPHIHFKVVAAKHRELVTQLYFAGESTERGSGFGFSKERDRLTVTPTSHRDGDRAALAATFDLVLASA